MLCKNCGSHIDVGASRCPVCGEKVEKDDGSEFWGEEEEVKAPEKKKEARAPREDRGRVMLWPLLLALGISIMCLAFSVVNINVSKQMNAEMRRIRSASEELRSQLVYLEARVAELEKPAELPQAALPQGTEEQAQPIQQTEKIKTVSAPTAETKAVGYESRPDYYIFGFKVSGDVDGFYWEKKVSDNEWEKLEFDDEGYSALLGLKMTVDMNEKETRLIAAGLTAESAGIYRATAYNDNGDMQRAEVALNIEET